MFNGDIICRSKHGHGATFVFIVALSNDDLIGQKNGSSCDRIQNPIKKDYEKIELNRSDTFKKQESELSNVCELKPSFT